MNTDSFLARIFSRSCDPRVRRAALHAEAGTVRDEVLDRVLDDLELAQEMELEQEGWDQ